MKRLLIIILIAGLGVCYGQTSNITATITDPDAQTWNNGNVQILFIPTPGVPGPFTWTGGPLPTKYTATMNAGGTFTIGIPDNNFIKPAGSMWQFTLCSNTSAPCQNVVTTVTGGAPNLSSVLSAGITAPRFNAGQFSYGYLDVEVQGQHLPGDMYYNVTSLASRQWNGSAWGASYTFTGGTVTGATTFNSSVSFNGGMNSTGNATAQSFGGGSSGIPSWVDASTFPGSDPCTQANNAALAITPGGSISASGGVVDMRSLNLTNTCSIDPGTNVITSVSSGTHAPDLSSPGVGVTFLLPSGVIKTNVPWTIGKTGSCNSCSYIGQGRNTTVIKAGASFASGAQTGTATFTNGGTGITGAGTSFQSWWSGAIIYCTSGACSGSSAIVATVTNTTTLTLAQNFTGATQAGATFSLQLPILQLGGGDHAIQGQWIRNLQLDCSAALLCYGIEARDANENTGATSIRVSNASPTSYGAIFTCGGVSCHTAGVSASGQIWESIEVFFSNATVGTASGIYVQGIVAQIGIRQVTVIDNIPGNETGAGVNLVGGFTGCAPCEEIHAEGMADVVRFSASAWGSVIGIVGHSTLSGATIHVNHSPTSTNHVIATSIQNNSSPSTWTNDAAGTFQIAGGGATTVPSASTAMATFMNVTASALTGFTYTLTGDVSITSTGLTSIGFAIPVQPAHNVSFHCSLVYSQSTAAVADEFGIGIAGGTVHAMRGWDKVYTNNTGTVVIGNSSALINGAVTAMSPVFTPSATATDFVADIDGSIEMLGTQVGTFNIYALTGNAGDALVIKQDSYCYVI
jgi:hypothetical protein